MMLRRTTSRPEVDEGRVSGEEGDVTYALI